MGIYAAGFSKTTGAVAGPIGDVRTTAGSDARVWEIGVFAETAVAGTVGLVRATGAGTTPGGAVVPVGEDSSLAALSTCDVKTTYATEPTQATVYLRRAVLPATIGAGIIWTFRQGLVVPVSSGLLIRQLSALAVTYSVYVVLDA